MDDSSHGAGNNRVAVVRAYRPIDEIIPAHWEVGDVQANGIRQRYYRTGAGRAPAVLLHGIMEGALAWLPTAQALEADYDVILLDARGHGHSSPAGGDFSPDTLAADVAGALDALGLNAVRLLGFSLGANTAALVADRRHDLVSRVILGGLAPEGAALAGNIMASPGYQTWLSAWTAWLEGLKTQGHIERMVASLSQVPPGAPLPPEEEYVAWVENSANLDLGLVRMSGDLWEQVAAAAQAMEAAVARITCPMLLIKSELGPYSSGPLIVREERADRPNVRIVHFENTGHVIYRDRFAAFVDQVQAFFGQV